VTIISLEPNLDFLDTHAIISHSLGLPQACLWLGVFERGRGITRESYHMSGYIKFDGITNQAPQNFNRTVALRGEEEASGASPRDAVDTFSKSNKIDKASPGIGNGAVDNASSKAPDRLDIRG
jgi:hypothetical protein